MALTPAEEVSVRNLIAEEPELLALATNEPAIISKLGATKVTLSDLVPANSVSASDLFLVRQGTDDKSVSADKLPGWDMQAVDVDFTPAGNLQSADVQAALEELDAEKQPFMTGPRMTVMSGGHSGVFTVPPKVTRLRVTMCGGGGGGACYTDTTAGGGGGGGGGALIENEMIVTPGDSIAYSVGAGGIGGQVPGAGNLGGSGGVTSFGSFTCGGGTGGTGSGSGGAGGSVTGATGVNMSGQSGQQYNPFGTGTNNRGYGGNGGASGLGAGGYAGGIALAAGIGMMGGGGGGGTAQNGAPGGNGIIIVKW